MAAKRCKTCGAEFGLRPERCPLCGGSPTKPASTRSPKEDVESYQARLRRLKEQLNRLRDEDAEAV